MARSPGTRRDPVVGVPPITYLPAPLPLALEGAGPSAALGSIQLVFIALAFAVALTYFARRLRIAEPILLLLGGIVLSQLPNLPDIVLAPDLVFILFLPPILFAAAYFTPIRDFKANIRPILLLAIGLVLFTTVGVAVVVQQLTGMPVAAAFALGAIVAPPDAVSATAVFRRLGVPRRIVTILEGESLLNDASALIAYRAAVVAAGPVAFSLADSTVAFFLVSFGGLVVGAIAGAIVTRTLHRTADPIIEVIISLLAPATAYVAAEQLGVSGVLATVVAGLITGQRAARVLSPDARLMGAGVWQTLIWLINAFVFMLIGLQMPAILRAVLADYRPEQLLGLALAISATVIVTRIAWVFPATYLPRLLNANLRRRDPPPPARAVFIVSWAGMRGVVSLAAAFALPPDFPSRDLILFLTFCVILATLVGQGLTLPWLIRHLGVLARTGRDDEQVHARLAAVEAALQRLDDLKHDYAEHLPLIEQLREEYEHEASHVLPKPGAGPDESEQELLDHRAIRNAVLVAQREAVIALRDAGVINDQTLRAIERDLDLEALRAGA
ncbi:MAG TPA: Na+/H+ antiporter [Methylomirabilota bacterium]|nr:Na+/H+ antiporter [Methylomirabilota bacterium]